MNLIAKIKTGTLALAMSAALPLWSNASTPSGDNKLTKAETKKGYKLLFDGSDLKGWHNYNKKDVSAKWKVEDGALTLTEKGGGDIITDGEYENFEFEFDWKISEAGNSGIFYLVKEDTAYNVPYKTGVEYQILDNAKASDNKYPSHTAASNYDLIQPSKDYTKPAGEWNHGKIVLNKGHVEHWLNGEKVLEYEIWSETWKEMVAKSKFKSMPGYAKFHSGHIGLQDHGDKVWYKNIKIRTL